MARIVCMTSGLRGFLNASFELVARLQQAGHDVTYACPHDVSDDVGAQGIPYAQLPAVNYSPAPEVPPVGGDFLGIRSRIRQWLTASRRRSAGVDALRMAEFRAFLEASNPDLVLVDSELYEHVFTVHDAGYPLALITPFFATWKAAGLPPLQSDAIPGEGFRGGRLGLELEWLKHRFRRWRQVKRVSLRHAFTERRSVLREYARRVGYPLDRLEQYSWVTMFNDSRLPVLSLTASELDFQHERRADHHYIGPMVAETRHETRVSPEDAQRLEAIYAEKKTSGRPLLYCWLTTMDEKDRGFLERVIEAVSSRPEWILILGHSGDAAKLLPDLPDHIHSFDYVPQLDVLRHADLCITHGGVNTINECLAAAVPMLVYSTGSFDKPGCAARIAHHGVGIRADIERDTAGDIAANVERALADETIGERLAAMRDRIARYKDEGIAEAAVAMLLERPRSANSNTEGQSASHAAT